MNITLQFAKLKPEERKALQVAFEEMTPYFIILFDKTYLGVHLDSSDDRLETCVEGYWSAGTVKQQEIN